MVRNVPKFKGLKTQKLEMAKEFRFGWMALAMRDTGKTTKLTDMED